MNDDDKRDMLRLAARLRVAESEAMRQSIAAKSEYARAERNQRIVDIIDAWLVFYVGHGRTCDTESFLREAIKGSDPEMLSEDVERIFAPRKPGG